MAILDFLTGEVLYNGTLQQKSIQNKHLDATEDGIRWARNILIQYVDENTILTGYRLHEDLNILELKVAPTRVVDVAIVTSEAVFKPIGMDRSLDWIWWVLAHEMLGWDESMIDEESSLWNALAVREILVWCLRGPECLSVWADGARAECLEGDKLWDEWEETEGEVGGFDYVGRDSLMD